MGHVFQGNSGGSQGAHPADEAVDHAVREARLAGGDGVQLNDTPSDEIAWERDYEWREHIHEVIA